MPLILSRLSREIHKRGINAVTDLSEKKDEKEQSLETNEYEIYWFKKAWDIIHILLLLHTTFKCTSFFSNLTKDFFIKVKQGFAMNKVIT